MLTEFITTSFRMVSAGRWDELNKFLALIAAILALPRVDITPGIPQDKVL